MLSVNSMNEKERFIFREAARSIERAFPRADFAKEFSIELHGKMSIYDALIKAGKAGSFHEAVRMVAKRFPASKAGLSHSWREIAEWSFDYDHGENRSPDH